MFVRNKQYIIFSLILPMVILGIVAFNEGDEDPIDIGLVDKSNTILSQQFTSRLNKNNLFIKILISIIYIFISIISYSQSSYEYNEIGKKFYYSRVIEK